jgi:hypothetical protein
MGMRNPTFSVRSLFIPDPKHHKTDHANQRHRQKKCSVNTCNAYACFFSFPFSCLAHFHENSMAYGYATPSTFFTNESEEWG